MTALLEIEDLWVRFRTLRGEVHAVNGVDLRVDDHPDAPRELARIHALAILHFGAPEDVQPLAGALREEVAGHLARLGHAGADPAVALETWMSAANLENRHAPGGIDARVLDELRAAVRGLTGA